MFRYWLERPGKSELVAFQASSRGGVLYGKMNGDRVLISGKAVLYAKSEIYIK